MLPFILTVSSGILLSFLYLAGVVLPVWLTVPATTFYAAFLMISPPLKTCSINFLPRMATLLYVLPFLHLWGYVFSDSYVFFPSYGASYTYQQNPHIIASLATVGLIGIIGLAVGFQIAHVRRVTTLKRARRPRAIEDNAALGFVSFTLLAPSAVFFAWLHAPDTSILSARYVDISKYHGDKLGFAGGGTLAYALIALLAVDTLKEDRPTVKLFKQIVLSLAFLTILVYFQILQGNRDILGLILSLVFLFLLSAARSNGGIKSYLLSKFRQFNTKRHSPVVRAALKRRFVIVVGVMAITFVIFQMLGQWRDSASSGDTAGEALKSVIAEGALFQGTWTAVLLSPLSTVGDLDAGLKTLRFGGTYLDILLSMPPGPIAKLFGYTRPFDAGQGLAFEMTFGLGGTHVTVTPLLNFSAPGVLIMLFLIGLLLGKIEILATEGSTWHVFLLCVVLVGLPGFFWYGEMYIIRAIMASYAVWFLYNCILPSDSHRVRRRFFLSPALTSASGTQPLAGVGLQRPLLGGR